MANVPTFSPLELQRIADCSLQHHFYQQTPVQQSALLNRVVRGTIQHLHAAGGPNRLNLPATLRHMARLIPPESGRDTALTAGAQRMVSAYHRRLRHEWPKIVAGNELLSLTLRLKRAAVRCRTVVDRLDMEDDGGITVITFTTRPGAPPPLPPEENIEATMLHALAAAAYPHRRPVRVAWRNLHHDRDLTLELAERRYRQNLEAVKTRLQAWLDGEILARPGLHCDRCPFKHHGCPLYPNDSPEEDAPDLPESAPPATLSERRWTFVEGDDFAEPEADS